MLIWALKKLDLTSEFNEVIELAR